MRVQSGTIVRTLLLLVALTNQLLTATGKNPLPWSEDELYQAFTSLVTILAAVISWWKNNSYSESALLADEYMHALKEAAQFEKN